MEKQEKHLGTTASGERGGVTTGEIPVESAAPMTAPTRPPLMGDKDYSDSHSATFAACEINFAMARGLCDKIGHFSAIIEAHFPNASEVYRMLAQSADTMEKHGAVLKKSKGQKNQEIGVALLYWAGCARKALPPKAEGN